MGNERMVDIVKEYGTTRIFIDSAADWGHSDPLGVPKTAKLMLQRGISEEDVKKICYQNALDAYKQSGQIQEKDWLNRPKIDQREKFSGNTVLRGGHKPFVEGKESIDDDDIIIE